MLTIERQSFFASVRGWLGTLTQTQVNGLTALLDSIEKDTAGFGRLLEWAAYGLATAYHETAHTWTPVEEIGHGHGHAYGEPAGPFGKVYYGRGYVQTTWLANYVRLVKRTGVPVVQFPERALEPRVAYVALSAGMVEGWYGKKLGKFIWVPKPGESRRSGAVHADYLHARQSVNGMDRADLIASYAHHLEEALRAGWRP